MLKVLVIEDSKTIRRAIDNILGEENLYEIFEAEDGDIALKMISENKYDLIILDLNLPKVSGESILKALKNDAIDIPIIVCSKESEKKKIIETLKNGAVDYICKPFTKEIFLEKVKKAIQGHEIILR